MAQQAESTRQLKIAKMIQQDISDILMKEGREFLVGTMVSVTKVRVTPDLGYAKVYLSVFPFNRSNDVVAGINDRRASFRLWLGRRGGKQLRIVPEINFFVDDSMEYAENIDNLLAKG